MKLFQPHSQFSIKFLPVFILSSKFVLLVSNRVKQGSDRAGGRPEGWHGTGDGAEWASRSGTWAQAGPTDQLITLIFRQFHHEHQQVRIQQNKFKLILALKNTIEQTNSSDITCDILEKKNFKNNLPSLFFEPLCLLEFKPVAPSKKNIKNDDLRGSQQIYASRPNIQDTIF